MCEKIFTKYRPDINAMPDLLKGMIMAAGQPDRDYPASEEGMKSLITSFRSSPVFHPFYQEFYRVFQIVETAAVGAFQRFLFPPYY